NHFITADGVAPNVGEGVSNVYSLDEETEVLDSAKQNIQLSSNPFGKGRGVYLAGLPYSHENTRILMRALYAVAGKEKSFYKWMAMNLYCELPAYPEIGKYAIVNNSNIEQGADIYYGKGEQYTFRLAAGEIRWEDVLS